jgi:ATPase subunit of ABC transporter with duplicated ATPase domains
MIEIDGLTKRYGDKAAVDGLSFVVEPGVVTGFLGPNGAGKSTTMRLIAGPPTGRDAWVRLWRACCCAWIAGKSRYPPLPIHCPAEPPRGGRRDGQVPGGW